MSAKRIKYFDLKISGKKKVLPLYQHLLINPVLNQAAMTDKKMNNIFYRTDLTPDINHIIDVYNSSGINRPTTDSERIAKMYKNSNLIVTAWSEEKLVGIARSLTDFCYCCYLSDLAVRKEYQNSGIGRKLIELTKNKIGEQTALILLSAPAAMDYYPKIGFQKTDNGFIIKRTK